MHSIIFHTIMKVHYSTLDVQKINVMASRMPEYDVIFVTFQRALTFRDFDGE